MMLPTLEQNGKNKMKYHRTLQPFKVISFDLDDTLYDNQPVMLAAEKAFLQKLQQESQLWQLGADEWQNWKNKVAQQNPLLSEDVVAWRRVSMQQLLVHYQKSAVQIETICEQVMNEFVEWRHKIQVPPQSIEVLNQLAVHYPLVAITNGNVDPNRIGLTQFSMLWRGGEQGRAKPHSDLFHQAARHFQISPQHILHVGDHLISDVQGAIQAGCQAVWLNMSAQKSQDLLPTLEIQDLTQLLELL